MGHTVFSHEPLLPPLLSVRERYVTIPSQQVLWVNNKAPRILYFLEGGIELLLGKNRKQLIDRGDAVFISGEVIPMLQYRARKGSQKVRNHALGIYFREDMLAAKKTLKTPSLPHEAEESFGNLLSQFSGFQHFPYALDHGNGWEILSLIRRESGANMELSKWKISALTLALVSNLLMPVDTRQQQDVTAPSRGVAAVDRACHYMLELLHTKLSLSQIAWEVQLSGEHLERLFQKHLGCTVFEYLQRIRIDKTKQLLLTTDLPVTKIALLSGFSSSSLLGRQFKRRVGITPLAYRLRGRKNETSGLSQFETRKSQTKSR